MARQTFLTERQREIDVAIAAALAANPAADYRELAAAAQTSTAQIRASLARLGLPGPSSERIELMGYEGGWNTSARLLGNPDA